jgi:hypothetical protein
VRFLVYDTQFSSEGRIVFHVREGDTACGMAVCCGGRLRARRHIHRLRHPPNRDHQCLRRSGPHQAPNNKLNGGGTVNAVDIRIDINSALNLGCTTGAGAREIVGGSADLDNAGPL